MNVRKSWAPVRLTSVRDPRRRRTRKIEMKGRISFNKVRELMKRDLSGLPTISELYRKKNEIMNQLRLESSAERIISGVVSDVAQQTVRMRNSLTRPDTIRTE